MENKIQENVWLNCELCQKYNIHKNDFENHTKSRKHIHNIQNTSEQNVLKEDKIKTKRLVKSYKRVYDTNRLKHIGIDGKECEDEVSANLNKLKSAQEKKDIIYLNPISDNFNPQVTKEGQFNRTKYKVSTNQEPFKLIESYVYSLTSYLSIKLALDRSVNDFSISVNEKRYQPFNDLIINIFQKEKSTTYAIRCKYVSTSPRQISSLKDANIILEKEHAFVKSLKEKRNLTNCKFLLFTTGNTTSEFQKKTEYFMNTGSKIKEQLDLDDRETKYREKYEIKIVPARRNDLVNVSSEIDNMYSIFSDKSEEVPSLFLYTNQRIFLHRIDEILKRYLTGSPSIHKNYYNYIENWANCKLGGRYLLTKYDVILKLGELLLEGYIISPKMFNIKWGNYDIWNTIVKDTDVFVIKSEPLILSKLCEPFNQMIEMELSMKFDSITKTVNITEEILENIKDPQIRAYLFEEVEDLKKDIHIINLYRVFWKAGKIPLLLSLENKEDAIDFILEVISFMKIKGLVKKFLLKSKMTSQFVRKNPKDLKIFSSLDDVKDLINLNDIKIKVRKEFGLSLAEIHATDSYFLKWISPSIFFDMILDRYYLKEDEKPNMQTDLKIILDTKNKELIYNLLYNGKKCEEECLGRLKGINPKLI